MKTYVYVTPFFPSPGNWRGAYSYDFVRALMRQLELKVGVGASCAGAREDKGWKVIVLKEGDGSDYEIGGVKVYTFKAKRLPSNIFPNLFAKWNQRSFLRKVKEVLTPLSDLGLQLLDTVEVCHCNTANYGIYALAMKKANPRCKTLLHHHDLASFGLNMGALRHCWLYNMIQFPVLRRMHEKIDCHVFISEASRRSFLAAPDASWTVYEDYKKQMRGLPYRPARINGSVILHNGVDKAVFKVGDMSWSGRKDESSFVIGCVGNMDELKDQMSLLKAVKLHRGGVIGCIANFIDWKDQLTLLKATCILKDMGYEIRVRFVGSGPELEKCRAFVKENGLEGCVTFEKEVRHEELANFYRSLDLFVLPSYHEGFGCVFTEAHSCGVPFITCEGQGMDDLIPTGDRDKWLCKQRSPEDLARKIGAYLDRVEGDRGRDINEIQPLNEDQDIDSLVGKFVKEIGL